MQFGTQEGSEIGLLPVNDTYNELRENEKRTNDDGNQENYHHLDLTFVKDEVDPSQYDHVTKKVVLTSLLYHLAESPFHRSIIHYSFKTKTIETTIYLISTQ